MAETGTGIGARLRAGREKMGLTQLQAAEKLHVDPKVVESLEAERFDALGAPVFVRGHLKHYSELINENGAALLELYAAATKPVLPDLTRLPKASSESKPSRLAVPALVILIGFVLVGIVFWIAKSASTPDGSKPKRGPQPVLIAPEAAQENEPVESAGNDAAPALSPSGTAAGSPSSAGAASSVPTPSPIAAANNTAVRASASSSASETGARVSPAAAGAAGQSVASGSASQSPVPTATRSKPMELTLRFAADSWVEVYDANGQKLFYDVGSASSSRTVSGTPPFRVTVANAPGVSLDVNGKPATVPANAVKGDEAQFVINRSGRIVRALPKADGG